MPMKIKSNLDYEELCNEMGITINELPLIKNKYLTLHQMLENYPTILENI